MPDGTGVGGPGPSRVRARVGAGLALAVVLPVVLVLAGDAAGGGTGGPGSAAAVPPAAQAPAAQTPDDQGFRPSEPTPQLPGPPAADPDSTRARADEILARDEFRGPQDAGDTIIDRIRRWIDDRLPDTSGPDVGDGPGNGLAFVILGLVVLGAIAALTWTLIGVRRTRRPDTEEADVEVDVTPLRSADEWADEAERCVRDGDHRGAVRARYRSLTTTLARRDLLADTPGRTAGEQRDDVAERAPDLAPAFAAVADLFERVWFGGDEAGPVESEAARDLAARVESSPHAILRHPSSRTAEDGRKNGMSEGES